MASEKIRLFAILIGINKYKFSYDGLLPLKGAVSDAEGFQSYLHTKLGVPYDQITLLTNEEATRSNIIKALKNLKDDKRIDRDDAIFLYYAGHGTELDSPIERGETPQKIQAIVPYDCDSGTGETRVLPIPDYVLQLLLSKIVEEKGDNITVVFDCCHSASGTRGIGSGRDDGISRSARLNLARLKPQELDKQIIEVESIGSLSRGAVPSSKFSHRGLGSHILLSACGALEEAKENGGHGRFTTALLRLLDQVSPDTLQYSDILTHPNIEKIEGQHPQCEGSNLNRVLFNAKIIPVQRKYFDIRFDQKADNGRGQYIVYGGAIHNINPDSEFGIYRKADLKFSTQLAIVGVKELKNYSFIAKLLPPITKLDLSQPTIAAQTKFGTEQERLRIHIPSGTDLSEIYDNLGKSSNSERFFENIDRVREPKNAHVQIVSQPDGKLKFTMPSPVMVSGQATVTQVQGDVDVNSSVLPWILSRIAHFYRELNFTNKRKEPKISDFIDVELYQLQEDYRTDAETGYGEDILLPIEPNLCVNGVVNLHLPDENAEELPYGIRIVNRSRMGLYANVFHFGTHDLQISSLAASHIGHTVHGPDIPLREGGGSLEIGFGPAGYQPICFEISNGLDTDIGFLKIYLSTQSVSLAYLPQASPFISTRAFKPYVAKPPAIWSTIVVPIILRRTPSVVLFP